MIYSSTYLCKVNPEMEKTITLHHNPETIRRCLEKIKLAYFAMCDNNAEEAIKLWPNYPQAHVTRAEMNRKLLTEKGWEYFKKTFIEPAVEATPNHPAALILATDFCMRAGVMKEAIKWAEKALQAKPENPTSLNQLVNIMREIAVHSKDPTEKLHYLKQAREISLHLRSVSTQHFKESTDMIYFYSAQIPFRGESDERRAEREKQAAAARPKLVPAAPLLAGV